MVITFLLYHFIIFTKDSKAVLKGDASTLYITIKNTLQKLQCKPLAVNGTDDHIHIATVSSPLISADDLVDEIYQTTNEWMENTRSFPLFAGWEKGYVVLSLSPDQLEELVKEVENQKLYHKTNTLEMELRSKGVPV